MGGDAEERTRGGGIGQRTRVTMGAGGQWTDWREAARDQGAMMMGAAAHISRAIWRRGGKPSHHRDVDEPRLGARRFREYVACRVASRSLAQRGAERVMGSPCCGERALPILAPRARVCSRPEPGNVMQLSGARCGGREWDMRVAAHQWRWMAHASQERHRPFGA
jgi:hypothetical protein